MGDWGGVGVGVGRSITKSDLLKLMTVDIFFYIKLVFFCNIVVSYKVKGFIRKVLFYLKGLPRAIFVVDQDLLQFKSISKDIHGGGRLALKVAGAV